MAEHTGTIRSLTSYVLDEAVRQCARWWREGHRLRVSVNVSAPDLLAAGLVTEVLVRLEAAGLPTEALCLELTETGVLAADPGRTATVLLAHLTQLPVDEIIVRPGIRVQSSASCRGLRLLVA